MRACVVCVTGTVDCFGGVCIPLTHRETLFDFIILLYVCITYRCFYLLLFAVERQIAMLFTHNKESVSAASLQMAENDIFRHQSSGTRRWCQCEAPNNRHSAELGICPRFGWLKTSSADSHKQVEKGSSAGVGLCPRSTGHDIKCRHQSGGSSPGVGLSSVYRS